MALTGKDIEVCARMMADPSFFARKAFPERFYTPFNSYHKRIIEAVTAKNPDGSPVHPQVVIAAGRGLGKTNTVMYTRMLHSIVTNRSKYCVYISANETLACEKTDDLRNQLTQNDWVRKMVGTVEPKDLDSSIQFSRSAYCALSSVHRQRLGAAYKGSWVIPLGKTQPIRGRGTDNRPDLIVADDVDDPRVVRSDSGRREVKRWFYEDLLPCVDHYSNLHQVIYVGTYNHPDCLLKNLMDDPSWFSLRLPVCNNKFETLCPEYMNQEQLDMTIERYRAAGTFDSFTREYMMQDADPESMPFKESYFQQYSPNELPKGIVWKLRAVIVDPSRVKNSTACDTGIIGIAIDTNGNIYVEDAVTRRMEAGEQAEVAVEMCRTLGARYLCVEEQGLGSYAKKVFEDELRLKGLFCQYIKLDAANNKKDDRIASLKPLYRQGRVKHNRSIAANLEKRLASWQPGIGNTVTSVDMLDALAYTPRLLDLHSILPGSKTPRKPGRSFVDECYDRAADPKVRNQWHGIYAGSMS